MAGGITVIGLGMMTWHAFQILAGYRSLEWPRAEGRILEVELQHDSIGSGRGPIRLVAAPRIVYEYEVEGVSHEAYRIQLTPIVMWRAAAVVGRYAQGQLVAIAYDPEDPSRGLLEPGPTFYSALHLAYGAGVLALGVLASLLV
ncbi:MAG TPA: DUF3592 domain-containing protein [Gemmatimonadaceae bacterium]|nr:DUF3592 domain-containing protein [Gemmatimonadaceae bacterium]